MIIESVAVLFSVIYVVLAARKSIWCWIFSAISVILYIFICFEAELFAETGLQIFYLFMTVYGYYSWGKEKQEFIPKEWAVIKHLLVILFCSFITFLLGYYLTIYTSSKMPMLDSFTTVFSLAATYMLTKKVLGNWVYWIIIDLASIYLYFNRNLKITALLFIVYTIVAIFGYFSWRRKILSNA